MNPLTRALSGVASAAFVIALLASCVASPSGPGPLAEVVAEGQIETRASDYCNSILSGNGTIVAAYDSTSGEVRDLARLVETRLGWDEYLPQAADTYAAVCIYDVSDIDIGTAIEHYTYMARWAGEGGGAGGIGLITMW